MSENTHMVSDLENLRGSNKIWSEFDTYRGQLEELFNIINPPAKLSSNYKRLLEEFCIDRMPEGRLVGSWIYFPWNGNLVHILNEEELLIVRTNRNQKIISHEEQKILRNTNIGILGLSIGNSMALSLAYSGIGDTLKLADFDKLELSNLNRVRMGLSDLGFTKIDITARQIYEINPYAKLDLFTEGINKDNLNKFVEGEKKPKIIFEAIDDFEMKVRVRLEAKKAGVPVIMLTNLGDRLLIDVERYDQDSNILLFNGLIGEIAEEILVKPISETDKQRYAVAIVGEQNLPQRVLETMPEINKTLVGRPQVMSTVTIGGGTAAYLARRIVLGPQLNSGRYLIDFETLI